MSRGFFIGGECQNFSFDMVSWGCLLYIQVEVLSRQLDIRRQVWTRDTNLMVIRIWVLFKVMLLDLWIEYRDRGKWRLVTSSLVFQHLEIR